MATEDDLRTIALALPGVEERTTYGKRPSWKVEGRGFVGVWKDETSAVFMAEDRVEKEALIAGAPDKFFTTPHYGDSARLLVRLDAVTPVELRPLVEESWRQVATPQLIARPEASGQAVRPEP
jgi:hypothetical protein